MATSFQVEDGSGLSNSNSYASVSDADDYIALRGLTGWATTQSTKEAALVKATDWLDANYRMLFSGVTSKTTQALCWPRSYAYYQDTAYDLYLVDPGLLSTSQLITGVPKEVKNACILLALYACSMDLDPYFPAGIDGKLIRTKSKVGVIEEELEYSEGMPASGPEFPSVEKLLARVCNGTAGVGERA